MALFKQPHIMLRYDYEDARSRFEAAFDRDFRITACSNDRDALATLHEQGPSLSALFVVVDRLSEQPPSELLMHARDAHPRLKKVLIGDTVALDALVTLLEKRLIDRCFEQPVNPDLIRSLVLASSLLATDSPPTPAVDQPESASRSQPTVLIVDDETTATRYLALQLERLQGDFRVVTADRADRALELIHADTGDIAVVMTDQRMPGMQGKELLDTLKQSHPATVRILTSAYGEVDVALDAVNEGGIFRYQKKPWRASDLLPLFQEAIARHKALTVARNHSRSELDHTFTQFRQRRLALLETALQDSVGRLAHEQTLASYFAALSSIECLPPNTSHIRASKETALETDLVNQFNRLAQSKLATLNDASSVPTLPTIAELREELQLAATHSDEQPEAASSLTWLCRSLVTLQHASGLNLTDLHLHGSSEPDGQLVLSTPAPIRVYSHLLAPLTRISRPLLEQQAALLMLFVTTHRLGGIVKAIGGPQRCDLTITFTPGIASDQA